MADFIKQINTADGPKQIDYTALANLPSIDEQQSDWNQNDETASNYMKNRTHYVTYDDLAIDNQTVSGVTTKGEGDFSQIAVIKPLIEDSVCIVIDGVKYENVPYINLNPYVATLSSSSSIHAYGDAEVDGGAWIFNELPFVLLVSSDIAYLAFKDNNTDEHTVSLYLPTVHQLDEKYIPDTLARIKNVLTKTNTEEYTPREDYHPATKKYVDDVKDEVLLEIETLKYKKLILVDSVTGYEYTLRMEDGTLVTSCKVEGLSITTMPTKVDYVEGGVFDPTGMVVAVVTQNGSSRELSSDEYTYEEIIPVGATGVTITYSEGGEDYTVEVPLNITPIVDALIDFEYTYDESTGMYTITDWKETYQGISSTELIVPDSTFIIL